MFLKLRVRPYSSTLSHLCTSWQRYDWRPPTRSDAIYCAVPNAYVRIVNGLLQNFHSRLHVGKGDVCIIDFVLLAYILPSFVFAFFPIRVPIVVIKDDYTSLNQSFWNRLQDKLSAFKCITIDMAHTDVARVFFQKGGSVASNQPLWSVTLSSTFGNFPPRSKVPLGRWLTGPVFSQPFKAIKTVQLLICENLRKMVYGFAAENSELKD